MTQIYLIRHAEAEGNFKRICQGSYDADLSENGLRQLELLKERCRRYPFTAVYSSPQIRAYKTAQAANFYHDLPITKVSGLREIHVGHWEGQKWDDIPTLFKAENDDWNDKPWRFAPEGGETMKQVYERIWDAVLGIVKENVGGTVCIASHGCAIRNFLCRARGLSIEHLNEMGWAENTSVSLINFDDQLKPRIEYEYDASHLDESTSTISKQSWWKDSEKGAVV